MSDDLTTPKSRCFATSESMTYPRLPPIRNATWSGFSPRVT